MTKHAEAGKLPMRSVWSWCQGWPLLLSFGTSIRSPASVEAVPVPAGTRLEQDASDDGSGAALAQRLGSSGVLPRHNIEGDKGRPGGQRLVEPCKADNTAIMIVHILIVVVLDAYRGGIRMQCPGLCSFVEFSFVNTDG
eukprot:scaffold6460_cov69-Phaeocystis_antarctica.AAC.6